MTVYVWIKEVRCEFQCKLVGTIEFTSFLHAPGHFHPMSHAGCPAGTCRNAAQKSAKLKMGLGTLQ